MTYCVDVDKKLRIEFDLEPYNIKYVRVISADDSKDELINDKLTGLIYLSKLIRRMEDLTYSISIYYSDNEAIVEGRLLDNTFVRVVMESHAMKFVI